MKRWIFNLFKTDFLKYAFDEQSKPPSFDLLETIFVDSNGKRYFRYKDDFDIPILRKGKLEQLIKELGYGISKDEMTLFLDAMEKALNKGQADVSKIGFLVTQMRERKDILIHPEILFEMVTTLYIREDENPALIDEEIHKEKFEQLKKDSQGGLYDFFYTAGLQTYIPYLTKLEEDWNLYLEKATKELETQNSFLSKGMFSNQDTKPKEKLFTSPKESPQKSKRLDYTPSKAILES